jgi:multimeric flavodoxin WrbA
MKDVRKGQAPGKLERDEFHLRFFQSFRDPAYEAERGALDRLEAIAWDAYQNGRKAPVTAKAGDGFADPDYDLSLEWKANRDRLLALAAIHKDPASASRVLLIIGSARNDGTCPGEMSKTFRLCNLAREVIEGAGFETDVLDLSLLNSEYGRRIHPCKGCASTAMPLCHWPCSCYPNHAMDQVDDWMAEIYERWTAAHGVIILTPVYWYQAPGVLKQMIDRLVCADGGNPDPTSTAGKDAQKAKVLELQGWSYPKHLAGRAYGLVVHGDVAGIEGVRRSLSDWLDWMGLIDAGFAARLDRMIGYYEPYASSHQALDRDTDVQEEVRQVARAVVTAVTAIRGGLLTPADSNLVSPRVK